MRSSENDDQKGNAQGRENYEEVLDYVFNEMVFVLFHVFPYKLHNQLHVRRDWHVFFDFSICFRPSLIVLNQIEVVFIIFTELSSPSCLLALLPRNSQSQA